MYIFFKQCIDIEEKYDILVGCFVVIGQMFKVGE